MSGTTSPHRYIGSRQMIRPEIISWSKLHRHKLRSLLDRHTSRPTRPCGSDADPTPALIKPGHLVLNALFFFRSYERRNHSEEKKKKKKRRLLLLNDSCRAVKWLLPNLGPSAQRKAGAIGEARPGPGRRSAKVSRKEGVRRR